MYGDDVRKLFPLREGVAYLEHGSYGVTPFPVLEAQQKHRLLIESAPKDFFANIYPQLWKESRDLVSKRFHIPAENLTLLQNVTEGINSVLRSLSFNEGDEILITNLTYGAVDLAVTEIARRAKSLVKRAFLPFPVAEDQKPSDYVDAVRNAITKHTKLAILDHITSGTGLVLPIKEMVAECKKAGVPVLVDAAHVPGQLPLDIQGIDADWYVAALHKWYFVPRGCAMMVTAGQHLEETKPAVLSWNTNDPYSERFRWMGTRDYSPILTIPDAFRFMDEFGEKNVIRYNHKLIMQAIDILNEAWDAKFKIPESMVGSMIAFPYPKPLPFPLTTQGCEQIQAKITREQGVTPCVFMPAGGHHLFRISAQIYNKPDDFRKFAMAVPKLG